MSLKKVVSLLPPKTVDNNQVVSTVMLCDDCGSPVVCMHGSLINEFLERPEAKYSRIQFAGGNLVFNSVMLVDDKEFYRIHVDAEQYDNAKLLQQHLEEDGEKKSREWLLLDMIITAVDEYLDKKGTLDELH